MQRTALVTGAAHGIGRATTELLLERGWTVGAFDVDVDALRDLERVAGEHGGRAVTGHLDVTDRAGWQQALGLLVADGLDLLVNNAGILSSGPFVDVDPDRHRAIVEVNVVGAMYGAHAAFPHLARTPGSTLVNLCSASAIYGQPDLASYSASKFAVRGLTEALELEWAEHGIRVMDLMPLFVRTDMVVGMDAASVRTLGVRLTPSDVARALVDAVERGHDGPLSRLRGGVHHPVGLQARMLALGAQVAPDWANRLLTKIVTRR